LQNPPMSLTEWYVHKADQCARLAKAAIDARVRADFEAERELWLQIAAEEIARDEIRFSLEPSDDG
jgi:hypothetical protein